MDLNVYNKLHLLLDVTDQVHVFNTDAITN